MGMMALILIGAGVLAVLFVIGMYNSLIRLRNQVKNSWSQIDVQLKRRHDLIPNLIETTKGYMKHERETLEKVVAARTQAVNAQTVGEKAQAEGALSGVLGHLFAVAESYPDLKANQNFLALQEELTSTENRIAFSRQGYNDQVLFYNNKIQMFPSNIIAGMFGFAEQEFFEIQDQAEKALPKVNFS
ncbi:MAG: LemA family protein [Deltaproteobacteria bacterium]|nr:LemA family protein [Deltaproteobacteria bacterium]